MDDAVLSAGSHIIELIKQKQEVTVITVFTAFGTRPTSWDAQIYLIKSKHLSIQKFEKQRKKEDEKAMQLLGVSYKHLDFIDGGFRKNNEKKLVYPLYIKLFSGHVHPDDRETEEKIYTLLKPLIHPSDILYAPLSIGNHADHIMLNHVAHRFSNQTYFWLDQPYAWKRGIKKGMPYHEAFRTHYHPQKKQAIICYTSQVKQLYLHGIPKSTEIFYSASDKTIDDGRHR